MKKISILMLSTLFVAIACSKKTNPSATQNKTKVVVPFSDPINTGNWVLNTAVSDEFDTTSLDRDKWHVVGELNNGIPSYKNPDRPQREDWIGRAPSQFSGDNYRLENGMLKLETRWEPDFAFSDKTDKVAGKDIKHENITTACIIGRKEFLYGYMEIKCKAADAEISSAFWATGGQTEFDMFEFFGDHRQPKKEAAGKDKELWWSMHDWSKTGKGKTTYTEHKYFDFRVADDFHVYGYDWNENGVKIYVDGKLFRDVSRKQINEWDDVKLSKGGNGAAENYVITHPLKIWLDQETFPWHGVPDSKEDLHPSGKVDFEIDYVRVWQKK
ncbi:family 16 glycosylhydrolase [Wenyingzhuangia aestuarii]|uniref:family 16 glycosylhydrolase n=1 Tax=Wenyingzhuangia aestuarii TaxID=1647582 RepID=UPI00143B5759|nr:family 16 glycosylhydrolase [Wenyingzhuangia aestuarii]NJB84029.1 beta-glucanase (GH16 family) [Wenyingzhuangia aestuarii]